MGWFSFGGTSGASATGAASGASSLSGGYSGVSGGAPYSGYSSGMGGAPAAGGGGGMQASLSQMQPMLSQMGGRGGGGGGGGGSNDSSAAAGNTIKNASMAVDKIGTAVTGPTVQKRAMILDLVPEMAHTGDSIGPVSKYPGGAAMARAADTERGKATDAFARDQYSILGHKIRDVNARGQVVHNAVGIAVEIAKLIAGGYGAYSGGGSGMAAGKSGMSGVGSYLGQEAATRQGQSGGGGGGMGGI